MNDRSIFKSYYGGILSENGDEIYYLAIIDNLCQYDKFKMGERLLKSFIHDPVRALHYSFFFTRTPTNVHPFLSFLGPDLCYATQALPDTIPKVCEQYHSVENKEKREYLLSI